jgi:hypothetical protein
MLLQNLTRFCLLLKDVGFDLIDLRLRVGKRNDVRKPVGIEVAYADCPDFP